jgi:hypothetical protein
MPHFKLDYFWKEPVSKHGHILKYWGVKISTYEFCGKTTEPEVHDTLIKTILLQNCLLKLHIYRMDNK